MGHRPPHVKPPKHLSENPPVPVPDTLDKTGNRGDEPLDRDPTRYGDWEKKGVAVDF